MQTLLVLVRVGACVVKSAGWVRGMPVEVSRSVCACHADIFELRTSTASRLG
jgi:hypothetical protein